VFQPLLAQYIHIIIYTPDYITDLSIWNDGTVDINQSFITKFYIDGSEAISINADGIESYVYLYSEDLNIAAITELIA
jgi:hypothetical protein